MKNIHAEFIKNTLLYKLVIKELAKNFELEGRVTSRR